MTSDEQEIEVRVVGQFEIPAAVFQDASRGSMVTRNLLVANVMESKSRFLAALGMTLHDGCAEFKLRHYRFGILREK